MLYQSQYFESSLVNFLGYGTDMDTSTAYQSLQYRQPNLNLLPRHDRRPLRKICSDLHMCNVHSRASLINFMTYCVKCTTTLQILKEVVFFTDIHLELDGK